MENMHSFIINYIKGEACNRCTRALIWMWHICRDDDAHVKDRDEGTLVLSSWASPVHALASRKSPVRTAILLPNCMSFSGPSDTVHSFRLTIPRCTRKAVWISSVISAKFLWLREKQRQDRWLWAESMQNNQQIKDECLFMFQLALTRTCKHSVQFILYSAVYNKNCL